MKVLLNSFHLNGHTHCVLGFYLQYSLPQSKNYLVQQKKPFQLLCLKWSLRFLSMELSIFTLTSRKNKFTLHGVSIKFWSENLDVLNFLGVREKTRLDENVVFFKLLQSVAIQLEILELFVNQLMLMRGKLRRSTSITNWKFCVDYQCEYPLHSRFLLHVGLR